MGIRGKSEMTLSRIREKVDESRFLLALAKKENDKSEAAKFGYLISAFVCSFGSIFHRLQHIFPRGKAGIDDLLRKHKEWKYLGETLRDNDHHNVGGAFYVLPKISKVPQPRRRSRLFNSRLRGRFGLMWDGQYDNEAANKFVEFCSRCVSEVELYLRTVPITNHE